MAYANKNEKALAFGESEVRQLTGRLSSLRSEYESKLENGGPSVAGRIPSRFTGLSIEERRAAKLDELRSEGDVVESKLSRLTYHLNELKELIDIANPDDEFWVWQCKYERGKIAEITGTNPASFVEE